MQASAQEISTCSVCGGALEETSGGGLGCMVCLLRVGIRGEDPGGAGQDSTLNAFGGDEGFGVYEIERLPDGSLYELGRGAMGVTYRAVDASLQRKAALKIIKIGIAGRRAEAHERFMREARMAAALRHENIATLFDFGLAKTLNTQADPMSLSQGGFVGTPAFASPEQFEHSALDARSDIYSLGVTLWFALTGKTPFGGRSVEEIRRAQQSNALAIKQLKAMHVPSRMRSLLKSMLALEPAARPGTQELAVRLRHCSAQSSALRRARVALATAVIAILGASAFLVFHSVRTQNSASNPAAPGKSIAVLPFENLSPDPDNAYLAEGVQDQILTDMTRIADLKVIGRTSVMQYKSGAARNLHEIGKQLGVAHLVEGSVQRSGNRVRVNAQLVHAPTERRLWGH